MPLAAWGHVRGPHFCGQAARLPPVPLDRSALTAPLPREQSRCQRPFLWGIAQGRTGHPLLRGRCIPSYWVRDRGHVRGPRFCGADCPVAPFFGSIHDDDTRSSESSLQGPNLFDQVCTGHLASARFDRHHHWPSCHVGSAWPHSRFCASCSLTWRAIFPQPIFHSISPPVLANLPCFQPIFPAAISYRRCGNWVCDRLLALVHGCRCHCTQDCHKLGNEDVRSYIW